MELLKPKEAGQLAGISPVTIKRSTYEGKVKSLTILSAQKPAGAK